MKLPRKDLLSLVKAFKASYSQSCGKLIIKDHTMTLQDINGGFQQTTVRLSKEPIGEVDTVVNIFNFGTLLRQLKGEDVEIIQQHRDLIINCAGLTTCFAGGTGLVLDRIDKCFVATIPAASFIKGLRFTRLSVASGPDDSVLTGVYVSIDNTTLEMYSTDGSRLLRYRDAGLVHNTPEPFHFIIAAQLLESLENKLASLERNIEELELTFHAAGKHLTVSAFNCSFPVQTYENAYPNVKSLIPTSSTITAHFQRDDLLKALLACEMKALNKTNIVQMFLSKNICTLKLHTPDACSDTFLLDVKADYLGEDFKIAFNLKYLKEFFSESRAQTITMKTSEEIKPALFTGDPSVIYLVMPIKIKVPVTN